MENFANSKEKMMKIVEAMNSTDEVKQAEALAMYQKEILNSMRAEFEEAVASNDTAILAQRGYRQLTAQETKWYQRVIEALKTNEPKQAFTAIIGSDVETDLMPTTIIEDVYKHLVDEHPLLGAINFQYVGYITKWILNDHTTQKAVWGTITAEITKEITSSFKVIDINQNKLSAYAVIEKGMLDLGPVFLDKYIRTVLSEALMCGLEEGIVKGTGVNQPIGLIRDISANVSFNTTTGYPSKTQVELTSFTPEEYGALIARMAVTEEGKKRKISQVYFLCNQTDYLTKVMPATTVLNANGVYVNNLFPFPTNVIITNELEDGEAVVFLKDEYFCGVGGQKNGVIEYTDEYLFFEDQRAFKVKQYATGRATDDTAALFLDISGLAPAYIAVKQIAETTPTA